jgi:hypothetical protein
MAGVKPLDAALMSARPSFPCPKSPYSRPAYGEYRATLPVKETLMGSLGKARSRFVDVLRSAGAGTVWIKSTQDPASVPSPELRESAGKVPEHDGQWLIDLGAKT